MSYFFYHAYIRVDGFLWYHSQNLPTPDYYVSQLSPIIHNYGLTLALAGFITDPDVGFPRILGRTNYKKPVELFRRYGVYAYPIITVKSLIKEFTRAAQGEGIVSIRGRTRLAYPFFTRVVVLMPGSELRTLIVSSEKLPGRLILNIGAKRAGVLSITLRPVNIKVVRNAIVSHPFNLADVDRVSGYVVVLPHDAGDIGLLGIAEKAFVYTTSEHGRELKITVPALKEE